MKILQQLTMDLKCIFDNENKFDPDTTCSPIAVYSIMAYQLLIGICAMLAVVLTLLLFNNRQPISLIVSCIALFLANAYLSGTPFFPSSKNIADALDNSMQGNHEKSPISIFWIQLLTIVMTVLFLFCCGPIWIVPIFALTPLAMTCRKLTALDKKHCADRPEALIPLVATIVITLIRYRFSDNATREMFTGIAAMWVAVFAPYFFKDNQLLDKLDRRGEAFVWRAVISLTIIIIQNI